MEKWGVTTQTIEQEFQAYKAMYKKLWPVIKERIALGEIAIYVHPWFGGAPTGQQVTEVLKVICCDRQKLLEWARKNNFDTGRMRVHVTRLKDVDVPHLDFWGPRSKDVFRRNRHLMVQL